MRSVFRAVLAIWIFAFFAGLASTLPETEAPTAVAARR
jgi:hypothetical protein